MRALPFLMIASVVAGCGGTQPAKNPPPFCAAGTQQSCAGTGGCAGVQTCLANGSAWGDCTCPPTSDTDAGTDAGTDGGTSAGKDAGIDAGTTATLLHAADAGFIAGTVLDIDSHVPILGAQVLVGDAGVCATTSDAGIFACSAAPGLQPVRVLRSGSLDWQGQLAIAGATQRTTFPLRPRAAVQTVAAGGGTVTAGGVTLVFPSGAYAAPTPVSATYSDLAHLSGTGLPAQFVDANGYHLVAGILDLQLPAPAKPVTLTFPAPASATTLSVALYALDSSGAWSNRLVPSSVANGLASFQISNLTAGSLAYTYEGASPSIAPAAGVAIIRSAFGNVTASSGATPVSVSSGAWIQSGTVLTTGDGASARIEFSDQSVIDLAANSRLTLSFAAPGQPRNQAFNLTYGSLHAVVKKPGNPGAVQYRTGNSVYAVSGGAFSLSGADCPYPGRRVDVLEVSEGDVLATDPDQTTDVPAGNRLVECENCPQGGTECGYLLVGQDAFPVAWAGATVDFFTTPANTQGLLFLANHNLDVPVVRVVEIQFQQYPSAMGPFHMSSLDCNSSPGPHSGSCVLLADVTIADGGTNYLATAVSGTLSLDVEEDSYEPHIATPPANDTYYRVISGRASGSFNVNLQYADGRISDGGFIGYFDVPITKGTK